MTTIGIDLGTTNSCAAYINEEGKPVTIAEEYGNTIPSAVTRINGNGFSVGKAARERAMRAPEETVVSAKRLIGLQWYDAYEVAQKYGMEIGKGPNNEPMIRIDGVSYSIPQISGEVLTAVKINAEKRLGRRIDSAVITVPAYFNDAQRDATRQAGVIAGLKVEAIISEPTAAALAYGKEGLIAVYDLGGGTFDISIVRKEDGKTVTVATGGDLNLGGDDIDAAIMRHLARKVEADTHVSLLDKDGAPLGRNEIVAVQRLRNAAEKLKIALCSSGNEKETVTIRQFWNGEDIEVSLSDRQLRSIMKPFIDRSMKCCQEAVEQAGITVDQLDSVVLVGGSTKAPYVRERVAEFFGKAPETSLNADEGVALGAALSIDLSRNDAFVDVTPLSLFMETADGKGCELIPRHSQLPARCVQGFSTRVDGQTSISFIIRQGTPKQNVRLGTLLFDGIAPGKAGSARIAVEFSVSKSGLICVRALDMNSGKVQTLEIKRSFA